MTFAEITQKVISPRLKRTAGQDQIETIKIRTDQIIPFSIHRDTL